MITINRSRSLGVSVCQVDKDQMAVLAAVDGPNRWFQIAAFRRTDDVRSSRTTPRNAAGKYWVCNPLRGGDQAARIS